MKNLKKFNEEWDFTTNPDESDIMEPNMDNELDKEEVNIFNDIEEYISELEPHDANDFLKSLIVFCNQKLNEI